MLQATIAALALLAIAPFDGEFVSENGGALVLRQAGDQVSGTLTEAGSSAPVDGKVQGGTLRGVIHLMGEKIPFVAWQGGGGVQLSLEGDDEVETYRRRGVAPAAPQIIARPGPARGGEPALEAERAPAPGASGGAGAAAGRLYKAEYDGWSVRLPEGWDGKEGGGMLMLGSRTESGLLIVEATEARDPAALRAGLQEDLAGVGLAGTVPALQAVRMPAGSGLFVEFPVTARDGTALQLRAVAVTGARGTVAILGTTTALKMPGLRARVDELARSVEFFAPKESPGNRLVAGEWWSYTSAGLGYSGGTEKSLAFCRDGRFFSSSESSYSGGAGTGGAWGVAGRSGSAGGSRWRAVGNAASGRVTVTRADGRTYDIAYRVEGDGMRFDGRVYGRTGESKYCR